MMKLDLDDIAGRRSVVNFLLSFPKPYEIRLSSGGKGLHMRSSCPGCPRTGDCYDCWIYSRWDDKNRLKLNKIRKYNNQINNVLWDIKRGKKAGEWVLIENEQQIDRFLRKFTGFY